MIASLKNRTRRRRTPQKNAAGADRAIAGEPIHDPADQEQRHHHVRRYRDGDDRRRPRRVDDVLRFFITAAKPRMAGTKLTPTPEVCARNSFHQSKLTPSAADCAARLAPRWSPISACSIIANGSATNTWRATGRSPATAPA